MPKYHIQFWLAGTLGIIMNSVLKIALDRLFLSGGPMLKHFEKKVDFLVNFTSQRRKFKQHFTQQTAHFSLHTGNCNLLTARHTERCTRCKPHWCWTAMGQIQLTRITLSVGLVPQVEYVNCEGIHCCTTKIIIGGSWAILQVQILYFQFNPLLHCTALL